MTLPQFYTIPSLTDAQLEEAIERIRKTLTWANGEYAADLHQDLDDLIAEKLRRHPEGEARAEGGNR